MRKMQTLQTKHFPFVDHRKDHVSSMLPRDSNTDPGGTTAFRSLSVKDLPQVSGFLSLQSDSKHMQPLVSSTQASSGFTNVARISGNSPQEDEVIYLNSACLLINERKDSAPDFQTTIHYPDMSLSSSPVSHSNPVSSRGNHHSFSRIGSPCSSFTSLVAVEQQLQSELNIQTDENLFSPTSHLFSALYGVSKSVSSISLDGDNAPYGAQAGRHTNPPFISPSRGISSVVGSADDSTPSNVVSGQLTCGTLPKASDSRDQATWSGPLLEQVYDSLMGSLNDGVPQPLDVGFPSCLDGAESQTLFEGISVKNVPSSSHVCSSSIEGQGTNPTSTLVDRKTNLENMSLHLARNADLFDSLSLDFKHDKGLQFWDDNFLPPRHGSLNLDATLPTCVPELDVDSLLDPDQKYLEMGSEGLLDAVVAKIRSTAAVHNSNDMLSKSTVTKASSMSMYSSQVKCEAYSPLRENVGSLQMPPDVNAEKRSHPSLNDVRSISQVISRVGGTHSITTDVSLTEKNVSDEPFKVNKKRARPGESTRPRPKDRQQIQDRVKELREIVPNGAKCSIDALLDRTIKHMIFLQSIAKHADKLKHAREPKSAAGATWGFGVGYESAVSPIIIEDLNQPGQMLIEMLCEEQDFFLEIADIIRGFNLTILKGVMEARNGKIWAHFVVEANRDITRMDIFMSLAQLLDQTTDNSASPCNLRSELNANTTIFPAFHPTAMPSTVIVAERFQ